MIPKYRRNTVKRMTIKTVFQDGQYVNIYSPDRDGWNLLLRFWWWLQTMGGYLMFGSKGRQTYINSEQEAHDVRTQTAHD